MLKNCIVPTIADTRYPIIIPIINTVTALPTLPDTNIIINNTAKAPPNAAITIAISPNSAIVPLICKPATPPSNTNKATPKLAPALIPSTEGPAKGLLKVVCNNSPAILNPMPTEIAVMA